MGSTFYNKAGEQRPRPLKVIFGSSEQAKVLIDATDIRVNSGNPVFFQRGYHPKERQKMRELRTELSLRQKRGEKHLTIIDGEIVTAPRPFLWRSAVTITKVRLLTHVLCKPTHFFFHSFIATISYSLQTSFNSLMKDWADKYHVWVPHEVTFKVKLAIIQTRGFSHLKGTHRHVFLYNICRIYIYVQAYLV